MGFGWFLHSVNHGLAKTDKVMLMGNGDYTACNEYLEGHEIVAEEQNMKMLHADQLIGQKHVDDVGAMRKLIEASAVDIDKPIHLCLLPLFKPQKTR